MEASEEFLTHLRGAVENAPDPATEGELASILYRYDQTRAADATAGSGGGGKGDPDPKVD